MDGAVPHGVLYRTVPDGVGYWTERYQMERYRTQRYLPVGKVQITSVIEIA